MTEWISVTEKLPEIHEWVLVDYKSYGVGIASLQHDMRFQDWDGSLYGSVTHWMPLPKSNNE
jgi:hypothetical protein